MLDREEIIAQEIGGKIRYFRKKKGMTIQELAELIHKGKSAVSKYEKGQIVIDILTLYEIADVLGVHTEQLLYNKPPEKFSRSHRKVPAFFRNQTQSQNQNQNQTGDFSDTMTHSAALNFTTEIIR